MWWRIVWVELLLQGCVSDLVELSVPLPHPISRAHAPNDVDFPTYKDLSAYLATICKSSYPISHCLAAWTPFFYYQSQNGSIRLVDERHAIPPPVAFWTRLDRERLDWPTLQARLRSLVQQGVDLDSIWNETRLDLSDSCHLVRDPQGQERCAPSWIGIGSAKCGTTALFHHLSLHPGLEPPRDFKTKELQWEERWKIPRLHRDSGKITGWMNPTLNYLNMSFLPQEIYAWNPHIKILWIMRDPVERAVSQYIKWGWRGRTKKHGDREAFHFPMESWFETEWTLLHQCFAKGGGTDFAHCTRYYLTEGWPYVHFQVPNRRMIAQGLYYHILRYWLQQFPSENILIVHYEYYNSHPVEALNSIFSFLGVPPLAEFLNLTRLNTRPRDDKANVTMMSDTFRKEMAKKFGVHNRMLYTLLGTDYWNWQ